MECELKPNQHHMRSRMPRWCQLIAKSFHFPSWEESVFKQGRCGRCIFDVFFCNRDCRRWSVPYCVGRIGRRNLVAICIRSSRCTRNRHTLQKASIRIAESRYVLVCYTIFPQGLGKSQHRHQNYAELCRNET